MTDDTTTGGEPRDGDAEYTIEIALSHRVDAELLYPRIENLLADWGLGTLSMRRGPDSRDAALHGTQDDIEQQAQAIRQEREEIERLTVELATLRARLESNGDVMETARKALRRGAKRGEPIPSCSCFSDTKPPRARYCNGVCEDAVEYVAAALAAEREACARIAEFWNDESVAERIRARSRKEVS